MGEEKKRNLFDKLKSAVDNAIVPQQDRAASKRPPATSSMMDKVRLTTDMLRKGQPTQELKSKSQPTAELRPQGPTDEQLSPRRLAMIDDYMRGEAKIEQMNDPAYMYKIVSDERAYQTRLLIDYRRRLGQLAKPNGPEGEALQGKIKRSQAIVQNLFKVLKRITGKQGHTGGTDFLSDK